MAIYKLFDINTATTVKPWGPREEQMVKDLIDTIVTDTIDATKNISGHLHGKVYASDSVAAIDAQSSTSLTLTLQDDIASGLLIKNRNNDSLVTVNSSITTPAISLGCGIGLGGNVTAGANYINYDGSDSAGLSFNASNELIMNNNVGIGTTPNTNLDVNGNIYATRLRLGTLPTSTTDAYNTFSIGKYFTMIGYSGSEAYILNNLYYGTGNWRYRESDAGAGGVYMNFAGGACTIKTCVDGTQDAVATLLNGIQIRNNSTIRVYENYLNYTGTASQGFHFDSSDNGLFTVGVVVGSPTGGAQGAGTINAEAVYDDGVLLTDYVFEKKYDKKYSAKDKHLIAQTFENRFDVCDNIDSFISFVKDKKCLPAFYNSNNLSVGSTIQKLWESIEVFVYHLDTINERLKTIHA